jgi:preprotein translocase SecE subunit
VARDRNRSKQRRTRKPGAGGPSDGSTDARAREIGFEPSDAEQDSLPAAEKASPYVDEARMAEAGAEVPGGAPADDNIATDPAVLEERDRRPRRKRGRVLTFLGHVIDELRRVQWPDRRQTGQGTAVTLGFVVVAGSFLGLMDALWRPLIDAIL